MAHFPGHQSEQQRQRAFQDAGLTVGHKETSFERGVRGAKEFGKTVRESGIFSTQSFQTEEQRKATFEGAGVIDSTVLQDTQDIQFTTPDTTTTDISGLDTDLPELPPTPAADQVSDFAAQFQELQTSLLGEETFRQEQREELGVSALRTTQEDLVSQIQGFQLQSQALANEFKLASERIQQESIGRGRTVGGVAPLTAAAQRRITLRQADVASQALTASATLNAVQGRLVTAQRLIEEAVQKKFGALKAEKEAIIENVSFLINSGILNREEKKRAEAVRVRENARLEEVRQNEIEQKSIWDLVVRAAPNLAEQEGGGIVLDQAMNAGTKEEALSILSAGGAFVGDVGVLKTQVIEAGGRRLLINTQTGETIRDLGLARIPSEVKVKEPTSTQRIAAGFAARIEQSGQIIADLEAQFVGKLTRLGIVPEALKSEDRKLLEQAERNFINALLRRESGAAIAPSEFESAKLQYFPIAGDTEKVLLQKKANRNIAFESLRLEAGDAFAQLKGVLPPIQQSVKIGNQTYSVGTILTNSQGQRGRVEADGTITLL